MNVQTTEIRNENKGKFGWYIICMCLPASEIFIGGFIRVYEIGILAVLISIFLSGRGSDYPQMTRLDIMVLLYAIYQIIVVMIGAESFYESARAYRYLVLGPVLMYFIVRMLPFSLNTVSRAHVLMVIMVLIQSLLVIAIYIEEGRRPKGVPHPFIGAIVKYAFHVSYLFVLLIFSRKFLPKIMQLPWLGALAVITAGLLASASRGVTLPTILFLLLVPWIWKSTKRRRLLAIYISGGILLFVMLIAFSPPKFEVDESEMIEDARSIERIISVSDYLVDINGRIRVWAGIFDVAMERPLLGHGASAVAIKEQGVDGREGLRGGPTHSHNIIVRSAITGGLIAVIIFVGIIISMSMLIPEMKAEQQPREAFEKSLIVWFIVSLIVGLTNDIMGGRSILFFFLMGFMQQIVLHGRYVSDDIEDIIPTSDTVDGETTDNRILRKSSNTGDNILSRKSK